MSDYLLIGKIIRPHGVRGELVLEAEADLLPALQAVDEVLIGDPPVPHRLAQARGHRGRVLIQLLGCDDRDAAEAYRDLPVRLARTAAPPLPPGTYFWSQILGLAVHTTAGEDLGTITEIIETGANDVYVVTGPGGEVLIPAAPGVVARVDLEARQMTVTLPEGLRD